MAQRPVLLSSVIDDRQRFLDEGGLQLEEGAFVGLLVEVAALDSQPPLLGSGGSNGLIPEGRPLDMSSIINSQSHFVTPDYFRALRIPLKAGRAFTPQDVRTAPLVMVINETLAREAFEGQDPIGKRIT